MNENRSFKRKLGYLMRDGLPDVDGLTGEEANLEYDEHRGFYNNVAPPLGQRRGRRGRVQREPAACPGAAPKKHGSAVYMLRLPRKATG